MRVKKKKEISRRRSACSLKDMVAILLKLHSGKWTWLRGMKINSIK